MTPKEKAGWINERFYFSLPNNGGFTGPSNINDRWKEANKCALIAANMIKDELLENLDNEVSGIHAIYWEQVKQEIEKL